LLEDEPEKIPDTEGLLLQLRELLDSARSMPLSASVMVNREEFGEILQDAIDALPEELRQARWLLKEREEVLQRADREAERIIDVARVRAERMVERTEVVREARRTAEDVVDEAGRVAAQMRLEAEDYVDRKLAAFEVVLDRTMQQVAKGRERLSVHAPTHEDLLGPEAEEAEQAFFDQDEEPSAPPPLTRACVADPHTVWVTDARPISAALGGSGQARKSPLTC
jgi:F0F1-type ATP synthase membrane subunit b/b'